jgi:hypothetical protein
MWQGREMPVDERFHAPRISVAVVATGDAGEALLIRAILENLGAAVMFHLVGTPGDFLLVLGQGATAPRYVVISGHGDERGLAFGEYGPGIDVTDLVDGAMPPARIAGRVDLPGRIVVSTACGSGSQAFSEAFIGGGVAAYIAPTGYPDGSMVGLFVHILFHQLLCKAVSPEAALREAL